MSRNNITVDKVLADLEHDKIMARQAGLYSVAKECSVAQGKYLAMFTDKTLTEEVKPISLTEEEKDILREQAKLLTRPKLKAHRPGTQEEIAERNAG